MTISFKQKKPHQALPAAVLVILVKFMEKSVVHRQAVLSIKSSAKIKISVAAKNH
ncbi:hypothetical protein [uncultured Desulfobacter sp.]|uniref:hypothetical protein n=1 Tax=uncultured Desulfobacter sp. TaxID=240139 RepID=UPI0029C8EC54|nr:hypothetical protein [uncultured Desulfobacter sp.]